MALLRLPVLFCHGVVLGSTGSSCLHPRQLVAGGILVEACWSMDLVELDLEVLDVLLLQVASIHGHPCPIVWFCVG